MGRYCNFIVERFKIANIENSEYKANLWSALIINIFYILIMFVFFETYINLSNSFLNWELYDFFIYTMLILLGHKSYFIFSFHKLNTYLLKGDLNQALFRPINSYIFMSFNGLRGPVLIIFFLLFVITLTMALFHNYNNFFYFLIFFLFSFFYSSFYMNVFDLLAFFMKQNSDLLLFSKTINESNRQFIPVAFDGTRLNFFYLLPSSLLGFFSVMILKNELEFVWTFLPYLILSGVILFILNITMWTYGLKKYEAFG